MSIWAIADLHLAFGAPEKSMEVFGEQWAKYPEKIARAWKELIGPEDLVLIAGDISWAMRLNEAKVDLDWIGALPGTKVMIRGNHDYWWDSAKKVRAVLPPSCHIIQNDAFLWKETAIAGTRLWDNPAFSFQSYIDFTSKEKEKGVIYIPEDKKILDREIERLRLSLMAMPPAKRRMVMTHYPPLSADLQDSIASQLLEKFQVEVCVFGHLHNVKKGVSLFGEKNGIRYLLTSCDYLNFIPLKVSNN